MINNKTYMVFFFIEHEGGNGLTSVGVITSLTTDADSGAPNAMLIDSAGNGTRRGGH